jgi:hypothetical protein
MYHPLWDIIGAPTIIFNIHGVHINNNNNNNNNRTYFLELHDFRFSHLSKCGLWPSELWRCVVLFVVTNVSEDSIASLFKGRRQLGVTVKKTTIHRRLFCILWWFINSVIEMIKPATLSVNIYILFINDSIKETKDNRFQNDMSRS